jgi:hypothetical protein
MNEIIVYLFDSDGNEIMAIAQYNVEYPRDFKVLNARVLVNFEWVEINNLEMLQAQYANDILRQINSNVEKMR